MKKHIVLSAVVVLFILAQCAGVAGHIDLPVKWSQLPDMGTTAWDFRAEHEVAAGGQIVADDWMCNDPNPIIAIRWWGSYLNSGYEPPLTNTRMLPFEISFHTGDSVPPPNSLPGLNPEVFMIEAQEDYYGVDGLGNKVYEYNAYIQPWYQTVGQIYWLDVELDVTGLGWPFYTWGWHNTNQPWGDHTAFSTVSHNGPWNIDCEGQAFELMVVPEPGSLMTLALGALGIAGWALKGRKRR